MINVVPAEIYCTFVDQMTLPRTDTPFSQYDATDRSLLVFLRKKKVIV